MSVQGKFLSPDYKKAIVCLKDKDVLIISDMIRASLKANGLDLFIKTLSEWTGIPSVILDDRERLDLKALENLF